ncbi:MAG: xanthine dehydrogenase accessory factor [Blastocatellia bacterium]|jgi:xanthine dehydrogenase accessory factor|nr:xanthine dehydrogenase accessory factor [Blastocatellia bacterium]
MSDQKTKGEAQLVTQAIGRMLDEGATGLLVTVMHLPEQSPGDLRIGSRLLATESGERTGTLGAAELDEEVARQLDHFLSAREEARSVKVEDFAPTLTRFHGVQLLFERIAAEPRLVIAGAGHVGAALARLAALVGYRVTLIDDRAEFLGRELFASSSEQGIALVVAEHWADAVREAIASGAGVSVAIVTRGHKQDEDCLRAAISANPSYIGMIGSKRRTNIVLDKLLEEGADAERLKKVRAPIGLDIGAVSPEEVALAILAEIVAERRGGLGAPLSSWRRT